MNNNSQRNEAIDLILTTVEPVEWNGKKIPGVKLAADQEWLYYRLRAELRAIYPEQPAIAIHFDKETCDHKAGWNFYEASTPKSLQDIDILGGK